MATKKTTARGAAVKHRANVPANETLYMVRRTFPGTRYGSIPLERGRLIRMHGYQNDQKLLRLEYIEEVVNPGLVQPSECGGCGGEFIGMAERDLHFERSHKDILQAREQRVQDLTEATRQDLLKKTGTYGPEDIGIKMASTPNELTDERIIERENKIAPLALDKTTASRK